MSDARRFSEQEQLSLALSSAEMGTWGWDIASAVIWWDERMHSLFGLAPGTFEGSYEDFLGLIHTEDRERIRGEFARATAARTVVDTEFQVTWPSDRSEHVVRIRSRVTATTKTRRSCGSSASPGISLSDVKLSWRWPKSVAC